MLAALVLLATVSFAAAPCRGRCAREALARVCGGRWTGPSADATWAPDMLVSAPSCRRCAGDNQKNLTAAGVSPSTIDAICAARPPRWNPLAGLKPLPKIHHASPYCAQNPTGAFSGCARNEMIGVNEWMDSEDPLQLDMARITGAVPIRAAFGVPGGLYPGCYFDSCWHNKTEVVEAVKIAAKVNASLGIYYDPWSSFWSSDPSVRGAGQECHVPHCDPSIEGIAQTKELSFYAGRLRNMTRWLRETNGALGADVKVDAVIFDMELFFGCATQAQCTGLTRKSDLFYNLSKQLLGPETLVIQYNRGTVVELKGNSHREPLSHDPAGPAWSEWPGYTAESLTDGYGVSLYAIPEIGSTRDAFRHTLANAQQHGVQHVVPFLAFGVGFQRTVRGGNGDYGSGGTTLNYDWNYEYIYDWILGNELNDPWPWNASAHPADPGTVHYTTVPQ
jgi:hypothetical protein